MASLIDVYSNYLGVYPKDRPVLNEKIFPLPFDKFICIHNDFKLQSKGYEYFEEVISLLKPVLQKEGYRIIQVGGDKDPILPHTDAAFLGLSWGQSFYILKQCSLFLGIDSVLAHCAAGYNKPSVVLFSHTYPEQVVVDNWLAKEKRKILTPEWGDEKPSYSAVENPKMIRTIKVETIVQSVFDLLKISVKLDLETIKIGENYHESVIEIIPDFFGESEDLKKGVVHIRMDLNFNEQCLAAWLSNGYKTNIVSNQILNLELLKQFKENVQRVTLFMSDDKVFSPEYLKSLKAIGLNIVLFGEGVDNLHFLREKYFDFFIEEDEEIKKLDNLTEHAKFWTKKIVFSKGKKYPSIAHWRKQLTLSNQNKPIDSKEFWKDAENFYFYQ